MKFIRMAWAVVFCGIPACVSHETKPEPLPAPPWRERPQAAGSEQNIPPRETRSRTNSRGGDSRAEDGSNRRSETVGQWMPKSGKVSPRWRYIVIHHSATDVGGAAAFDRFHRGKGWDELGYHFVIGNGTHTPDGFVEVGSRWQKQKHGAHCKTPDNYFNDHGIGICLVGDFTQGGPTAKQMASLQRLVRHLCATCGIPATRIVDHHEVNRRTACPGRNFPTQWVRQWVSATVAFSGRRG